MLLQHASVSVRAAAVDFVAAAAGFLSPPDVYAHLMPMVLPALTAEPASLASQASHKASLCPNIITWLWTEVQNSFVAPSEHSVCQPTNIMLFRRAVDRHI